MKGVKASQSVVRKLDAAVVDALRAATARTTFKEWLLKMPNFGTEGDFARSRRPPRPRSACR
jgi:hypothetical protein